MFRKLFRRSEHPAHGAVVPGLTPHRTEVEFTIILIEAQADHQLQWTIRAVLEAAAKYGGNVLQILGPLVFVGFSGVVGAAVQPQRREFVAHVCSSYRLFVRVVHGRSSALVGMVGSDTRRAYTAIPDQFSSVIERLVSLAPGEATEHIAQQAVQSDGPASGGSDA